MIRRALRQLLRLLPAFALGFAVAAGGWAYYLRHDLPDWPGGRVAEYDRQQASDFAMTRNLVLPAPFGTAASDEQAFVRLNTTHIPTFPELRRPLVRETRLAFSSETWPDFADGEVHLSGRALGDVLDDLTAHSAAFTWHPGLRWGRHFEARPHVRATRNGLQPRAMTAALEYSNGRSSRLGLVSGGAAWLGWHVAVPSSVLRANLSTSPVCIALEAKLERAFRASVSPSRMAESVTVYPERNLSLTVRGTPYAPAHLDVLTWNHARGQAAVADELRRMVITEVVADTAVAGAGGGVVAAGVCGVASAVAGRVRRQRRASLGRCAGCGYDLRGSGEGGRCPECGASVGLETVRQNSDQPRHDVP